MAVSISTIAIATSVGTSCVVSEERVKNDQPHLYDVSQALMRAYNANDTEAIRSLLSPKLEKLYDRPAIERVLSTCRNVLPSMVRTSLPVSGTKFYGFFAAYGKSHTTSMILEIDPNNRIVFWAMADEVLDGDFRCALKAFGRRSNEELLRDVAPSLAALWPVWRARHSPNP
jgi:hypothetical protein